MSTTEQQNLYLNIYLKPDCEYGSQVTSESDESKIKRYAGNMAVLNELVDAGDLPLDTMFYLPVKLVRAAKRAPTTASQFMMGDGTIREVAAPEAAASAGEEVPFEE